MSNFTKVRVRVEVEVEDEHGVTRKSTPLDWASTSDQDMLTMTMHQTPSSLELSVAEVIRPSRTASTPKDLLS